MEILYYLYIEDFFSTDTNLYTNYWKKIFFVILTRPFLQNTDKVSLVLFAVKKNLKMIIKSSFCFASNIMSNCPWKRPQAWLMSNPATLWWYIIDNFLLRFQRKMKRKNKTLIREVNWNLSFVLSLSDNKAEHNNEVGATSQSAYRFRNMTPIMYKKGQWVH